MSILKFSMNFSVGSNKARQLRFKIDEQFDLSKHIVGVSGASGAGKSTLLKFLAGIQETDINQQILEWKHTSILEKSARDNPCVYVGNDTLLFEHLNVIDNLTLVEQHKVSQSESISLEDVIKLTQISHLLEKSIEQLSSGEQQRVKFARALLCGKSIVLLDESFSALDWPARMHMLHIVKQLHQMRKRYFILVSHSLKELAFTCDWLIRLDKQKLVESGVTYDVLESIWRQSSSELVFSSLPLQFIEFDDSLKLSTWRLKSLTKDVEPSTQHMVYMQSDQQVNAKQTLATIDADKVVLSRHSDNETSMLNALQGVITDIIETEFKSASLLVKVKIQDHYMYAYISRKSFERLELSIGEHVFAMFKAL